MQALLFPAFTAKIAAGPCSIGRLLTGTTADDCHWCASSLEKTVVLSTEPLLGRVSTLLVELKACTTLERVKRLHQAAVEHGDESKLYVANTLVGMYGRCGSMLDSRSVFEGIRNPDVVSWNSLLFGYASNGEHELGLEMFSRMAHECCLPDARTFVAALMSCTQLRSRERGKVIHLLASCSGFDAELYVQNVLVNMLSEFGCLKEARKIFDSVKNRDVVSWTSMISAYAENGEGEVALELFSNMSCTPNPRTFVAALSACNVVAEASQRAKATHLLASRTACDSTFYVQNTLVDLYVKCGCFDLARSVFEGMQIRNVVSWTALMVGYADSGEGTKVLELFSQMKNERCEPNAFTFVSVLKACALLGKLDFGRTLHAEIFNRQFMSDVVLANSLVDFYVKCGSLAEAEQVCISHPGMNLVTWTSLMTGYCRRGDAAAVFSLFEKMCDAGVEGNDITFLCLLTTCSHVGLVDKGKYYLQLMSTKYGIRPNTRHYTCMIDILGRANKLDDAMVLLRSMDFCPDASTWTTVLEASRKWKHVELGSMAFEALMSLDDKYAEGYVLMANI